MNIQYLQDLQDLRAKRINEAISASGYSYAELEKLTGSMVSKSSIQRYATGETKKIPIDFLEKLADVLNIDALYLIGWDDESTPTDERRSALIKKVEQIPDSEITRAEAVLNAVFDSFDK